MSERLQGHASDIAALLAETAAQVKRCHATAWDVIFRNGKELPAHVRLEHDWVQVDAPVSDDIRGNAHAGGDRHLWSLLTRNALLPPDIKLTVAVGDAVAPPVRLCGEIILDDAAELAVRTRELCTAIQSIAHAWPGVASPRSATAAATATAGAALCREAGWPVVERDEQVLVELDIPDGFAQAEIVVACDGGITARVGIGEDAPTARCEALALLLLRASASVRLVRAAADQTARFEVALRPPVAAAMLRDALCALSVAYRMVAREAAALVHDATIAAAYLRHCAPAATMKTQL
jgi:hypothetical protein